MLTNLRYANVLGFYTRGTSNAVNALAAMEQEVFQGGRSTLADYIAAVDAQDPRLLGRIAEAPKWGNDDDAADRWALALNATRDRVIRNFAKRHGLPAFAVCHVVRSLHHVDGRKIGPTADGRPGAAPVGDSIGAVLGTAKEGPTAVLNSVLKLDAARWFTGIYNLNVTLPASQSSPEVIRWLTEPFFADGGQEIQFNVLDADQLRRAQKHPDRYRDIVVRIAGLNARFVELSQLEQDELIRRAEAA